MKKYIVLLGIVLFSCLGLQAQTISEVKIDSVGDIYTIRPQPFLNRFNSGFWKNKNNYMQNQLKLIQKTIPENIKNQLLGKDAYVSIYFDAKGHIFDCSFRVRKSTPVNLSPQEWIELSNLFLQIKLDMRQLETEDDFTWGGYSYSLRRLLY